MSIKILYISGWQFKVPVYDEPSLIIVEDREYFIYEIFVWLNQEVFLHYNRNIPTNKKIRNIYYSVIS